MSPTPTCDCKTWAETNPQAGLLGNGHNSACPHFIPTVGAIDLLKRLTEGIKTWAAEEDGVPDWLWDAFRQAVFIVEGRLIEEGVAP